MGAMKSDAQTVEQYIDTLPEDRKNAIKKLRDVIRENLPKGFVEEMNYGMIGYVVPLSLYPNGYCGNKSQPLPLINIASQKNNIAIYHMGIYSDNALSEWFKMEYKKTHSVKLDMGKSCLRFKKVEHIPFDLIAELSQKITVEQWIEKYESVQRKKR